MKWEKEWSDTTVTAQNQFLKLTISEVDALQKALTPRIRALKLKIEKYRDRHDSGEATNRDENILAKLEEDISIIESFLKQ